MTFFWGAEICSQFDTLEIFWDLVSQIPSPSNWDSFDDYWNWSWWCHHVWWPIASGQPGPSRWNRCRFQNGDTGKCWWKLDELWRDVYIYNLYNILSMWWNDNENSTYTSQSWLQHICIYIYKSKCVIAVNGLDFCVVFFVSIQLISLRSAKNHYRERFIVWDWHAKDFKICQGLGAENSWNFRWYHSNVSVKFIIAYYTPIFCSKLTIVLMSYALHVCPSPLALHLAIL